VVKLNSAARFMIAPWFAQLDVVLNLPYSPKVGKPSHDGHSRVLAFHLSGESTYKRKWRQMAVSAKVVNKAG
jgi:hypothetical protein